MKVTTKLKYLRIAPRKVRLVANLIRGKSVKEAQAILNFAQKRAAKPLLKLLHSAIASATNNFQLAEENLYISKMKVDEGPKLKRWRQRARGQAFEIQKKTSHITLVLDEIKEKQKKKRKGIKKPKVIKKVPEKERALKEVKPSRERLKLRPKFEVSKPKTKRGVRKFFQRKAF